MVRIDSKRKAYDMKKNFNLKYILIILTIILLNIFNTAYSQDMHQLVGITGSHLVFNAEEESRGRASLREIGVEEDSEFVCFHARDASYLESELNIAGGPYNYRDADINRFIPGMVVSRRVCCRIGHI